MSVMLLAFTAAMGGCIILPIPTHDHGEGLSERQVHERLASGQVTRVDVLLTFGPPTWHKEEDRYFVYRWDRSQWGLGTWWFIREDLIRGSRPNISLNYPRDYPLVGLGAGRFDGVYAPNYLAMEFNLNGELLRYKYFSSGKAFRDDEFFNKIFPEWVNEPRSDYH